MDSSPLLNKKPPALRGNGHDVYRVHIIGNSGTGKSTLARWLAKRLDVPYISLDEVFWNPGWSKPSNEEFQARIDVVLNTHRETGWVIDGNYSRRMGPQVAVERTDCIWLDPPLFWYLPRLILRTFKRVWGLEPPCATGCQESLRSVFTPSQESIIWFCIAYHGYCRDLGNTLLKSDGGVENGGRVRRIGGYGGELNKWKQEVGNMIGNVQAPGDD